MNAAFLLMSSAALVGADPAAAPTRRSDRGQRRRLHQLWSTRILVWVLWEFQSQLLGSLQEPHEWVGEEVARLRLCPGSDMHLLRSRSRSGPVQHLFEWLRHPAEPVRQAQVPVGQALVLRAKLRSHLRPVRRQLSGARRARNRNRRNRHHHAAERDAQAQGRQQQQYPRNRSRGLAGWVSQTAARTERQRKSERFDPPRSSGTVGGSGFSLAFQLLPFHSTALALGFIW